MRKNVCYDINYDLPFDADMQIFTAQLYTKVMNRIIWKILENETKFGWNFTKSSKIHYIWTKKGNFSKKSRIKTLISY